MIFSKIKNFLKNKFKIKKNEETKKFDDEIKKHNLPEKLSNLALGTIIYAKRYSIEEEKDNIPKGHTEIPYIVIGKTDNELICLRGTSFSTRSSNLFGEVIKIEHQKYNLTKNTYFYTNLVHFINEDRFIKEVDLLDQKDFKFLSKKIECSNIAKKHDGINLLTLPIEKGDIILFENNLYYVLQVNNNSYKCAPITKNKTLNKINIYGEDYYINFDNLVNISKEETLKRKIALEDGKISLIDTMYENHKEFLKCQRKIKRGSLIEYNDKLYYVYGEEGNNWLAFAVSNFEYGNDPYKIIIRTGEYYTCFDDNIVISKDEEYKVMRTATENEIDAIKEQKKDFKKRQKYKKIQKANIEKPEIDIGVLVSDFTYAHTEYIVVYRNGNECVIVDKEKYENEKKLYINIVNVQTVKYIKKYESDEFKHLLEEVLEDAKVVATIGKKNVLSLKKEYIDKEEKENK